MGVFSSGNQHRVPLLQGAGPPAGLPGAGQHPAPAHAAHSGGGGGQVGPGSVIAPQRSGGLVVGLVAAGAHCLMEAAGMRGVVLAESAVPQKHCVGTRSRLYSTMRVRLSRLSPYAHCHDAPQAPLRTHCRAALLGLGAGVTGEFLTGQSVLSQLLGR